MDLAQESFNNIYFTFGTKCTAFVARKFGSYYDWVERERGFKSKIESLVYCSCTGCTEKFNYINRKLKSPNVKKRSKKKKNGGKLRNDMAVLISFSNIGHPFKGGKYFFLAKNTRINNIPENSFVFFFCFFFVRLSFRRFL